MNGTADLIEKLEKSELYRRYESAFSEAIGLPLAIRPIDAWKHPFHGRPNENDFCWLMARKPRSCVGCLRFHEKLARDSELEPRARVCHFGLTEVAAPIRVGGQIIGHLLAGQCATREPTDTEVENIAARSKEFGFKPEIENVRQPYRRTPVVSQQKLESITRLLAIFADHLSIIGQTDVAAADGAAPRMADAMRFIDERHYEHLSLPQLAQAVNLSTFYFCKLFRQATGVSFTRYVSRVRAEKAKNLLLNPNLPVGDIALHVGFGAPTNFNRVFRSLYGESPSEYRARLPSADWGNYQEGRAGRG